MDEYREAIRLKPDYAGAHYDLGRLLSDQGRFAEAVADYREAIRLRPDYATAHLGLGNALRDQERRDEAIAEYREAIRLKPDFAEPHCNLGLMQMQQGQFREALAELRRGHELGSKRSDWRYPSVEWVRQAERLVVLEERLHAVLRGEDQPKDGAEGFALASMAYRQTRYALSARLAANAFRADPKLAEDLPAANRYNAACSATLAGAGRGEDPLTDDAARSRWRKQAITWLRAELASLSKPVEGGKPGSAAVVIRALRRWKSDPDLAGIRDTNALARLPESERNEAQALWVDVDRLLERARGGKP
jgi:tetratricopeptide (TPR) repeat protein